MSTTASGIDLDFRPKTYFWPLGLDKHLLASVKGEVRRKILKQMIAEDRLDEIPEFLAKSELSEPERRAIGRIHPLLMGGEYLPRLETGEVEIARIAIQSTTGDVTSVYVRRKDGAYCYRVVDEYEGETLTGETEHSSVTLLSLGELYDFFLNAWHLQNCLDMNFEDDLDAMLSFFSGESAYYAEFDALLRERVINTVSERLPQDTEQTEE